MNEVSVLVTEDTKKAELLSAVFASVFIIKAILQELQSMKAREKICKREDSSLVKES